MSGGNNFKRNNSHYDVIIVGSGPVGLQAAIEAKRQDLNAVVLEKGILCNAIYNWPTQWRFFTEAKLLEIGGHAFPSSEIKPTRQRALDYYRRVTEKEDLDIRQHHEVIDIIKSDDEFKISGVYRSNSREEAFTLQAKRVVVAIGYFDNPTGLGVPGEDKEIAEQYYDQPHPYFDHDVVIIGCGNSGAETALELYRHGAHVTIVHKHPEPKESIKYWLRPDLINRIKDGDIKAVMPAITKEITNDGVIIATENEPEKFIPADKIFILTGYTPDTDLLTKWGMEINDDLSVKKNKFHETTTSGLYVVGSAGAGENTSTVFIENGRNHAKDAVRDIASNLNQQEEVIEQPLN